MGDMRLAARLYIFAVLAAAIALVTSQVGTLQITAMDVVAAVVLAIAASVAQVLRVVSVSKQAFAITPAFVFAGALMLPPELLVAVIAIAFIPEWIRYRRSALVMLFNIGNVLVDAYVARGVAISAGLTSPAALLTVEGGLSALLAVVVFISLNRLLIAGVL